MQLRQVCIKLIIYYDTFADYLVAFPNAYIRLCQFHAIQAILRWDCDDGLMAQEKGVRITQELKFQICILFRNLQRCRTWEEWPKTKARFLNKVRTIIFTQTTIPCEEEETEDENPEGENDIRAPGRLIHSQSTTTRKLKVKSEQLVGKEYNFVEKYFCVYWFTEEWIRKCFMYKE
jgi:hypothetical protein